MNGRWVAAVAALHLLGIAAGAEDFDTAFKAYKTGVKRPSLRKRHEARERLARTGDARALKALIQDYGRPEEPKDQVRYLIASITSEAFPGKEHAQTFDDWRARNSSATDAWLWFLALRQHLEAAGPEEVVAVARSDKNVFLRAAAIEALRFDREGDPLPFLAEMERKLPSSSTDRAVLLESLTALLCSRDEQLKTPQFAEVASALIRRMDEPGTMDRTRIAMGRQFARLFKTRFVWRDGARWQQELDFVQHGGKQPQDERYAPPKFAGIEASGDRICYVIDLSDSMLEPLTPGELKNLPKGPVTGTPSANAKIAKNDAWTKAFENVRWDKVTNKFEAAREMLKASLLMLEENQHFCVICFGDGAGTLKGTKGLQKATLDNIQGAIRTLDAIKPGAKKQDRPYGTLMGATNMHGGLHRAYKLKSGMMVGPGEYVNAATFDDGCDTIFLLSDGAPTWDDWAAHDSKDVGDYAGDPESGARHQDSDNLIFQGPYARGYQIIDDVTRLNLFRKAEIHCVGMGGAEMNMLETLAAIGKGRAVDLTQGK
ncbi:MAG TPA: hypothetical protein VFY93_00395 [Planctomycetota bacterium]|nr:hypothetical protein [Planctomycetota bacterium]